MKNFIDDDIKDELYDEISNAVESILGENVSEEQKLQLFDYLLLRTQEETEQYNDVYYNAPYQSPRQNFNIYIPFMQSPQVYNYQQPQQQATFPQVPMIPNANPNPYQFQSLPYNYYYYYQQPITKQDDDYIKKHKDKSKKSHKSDKNHKEKDKKKHKKDKKKKPKITSIKPYCTYTVAGRNYIEQTIYKCRTCGLTGNNGVCSYCAIHCHKGHDIYCDGVQPEFFCDCQDHGGCQLMENPGDNLECTFELSGGSKIPQPMYHCEDCDIMFDNCICQNCAIKLHKNHNLTLVEGDNLDKVCYYYKKKHQL